MNIVLLNWTGGEGDPFTLINKELKKSLEEYKINIKIIDLEGEWFKEVYKLKLLNSIDLVITHQGLGSNISMNNKNFWDEIKLPLLCLHSDHPSLCPINHIADSPYVIHSYCITEYAEYANNNLDKENSSIQLGIPSFYSKRNNSERIGDFFVFPKNINPVELTIQEWVKNLHPSISNILIIITNKIKYNYKNELPIDQHVIVDEILMEKNLSANNNEALIKYLHLQSDKLYRNLASELVLEELRDLPLVINGRGWDSFKDKKNKKHHFFEFNDATNGDFQFYSKYGVIDIVYHPNSLHDRTLRAISHRGGFLCNSTIYYNNTLNSKYNDLFFNGSDGNLFQKAVNVIDAPDTHMAKCRAFGEELEKLNPFEDFYFYLTNLISNFNNMKISH